MSLADPAAILDDLEAAIAGRYSFLPVPADDKTRAMMLANSQRVGDPIDDDIALVMCTSGSTGNPKGALLTAVNLVASADATHQALGGPGQWLLAMPAHHIAGIQVMVRSLIAGVDPLCLDLRGGFNVADFAQAASELSHTGDRSYTALTPMQLAKAMDTLDGIEALRSFDVILVGGAAINPQLAESAAKLDIEVVGTYGMSETSGGCVYDGRPIPGAEVRLDGERIVLGGPMVARGYRNGGDAFVDGWFHTSDAGELDGGVLRVTGRLDAVIDSGGLKLHPEVLEDAMLRLPGVEQACVTWMPHPRLGQAIVAAYTGWASITDIVVGLEDAGVPRWQVPKELRRLGEMPLAGPGKIDREAVRGLF